jgi:hypothetical protein
MRDQEQKLKKVKQILTEDSCLSSHAPGKSTGSLVTLCQPPVTKTDNISSQVFSSQSCKRVCTKHNKWDFAFVNTAGKKGGVNTI